MAILQITYAPNPIFKQVAEPVKIVDDEIKDLVELMFATARHEGAIGLGANMVGILKRIIIIDWKQGSESFAMINPEIIERSDATQEFEESSLSYPGIAAKITRPSKIKVSYSDLEGRECEKEVDEFLSTIVQHEIDYLNGVVFLDHLSKLKRDRLVKKMQKHIKMHPPHVHGQGCNH
ncbi:MAG: peptide deformylase [Rickettsiales bacterium]|jgi:peptide deformylase|nr:peptide deformylase [Rickettsiales bacterium]